MNLQDRTHQPTLEDISHFCQNEMFDRLCREMQETYKAKCQIDFSMCSFEPGWNVKFKKFGKTLCTIYPKKGYMCVMIVVGQKEKERVEKILPMLSDVIQLIYKETKEGNGQRWLMIDLEDSEIIYQDIIKLIQIRKGTV